MCASPMRCGVVAVNATFIWIAVSGADEVAPSYVQGER